MLSKFFFRNKDLLVGVLKSLILTFLKMQATGGIKGWLIKTIATEFAEEVIEFIHVNVDYIEMNYKVKRTVDNDDRNEATDDLNDIMS